MSELNELRECIASRTPITLYCYCLDCDATRIYAPPGVCGTCRLKSIVYRRPNVTEGRDAGREEP